ncbi:MAG TPA: FAD-dependent oxidoreductase [Syntrophales bacterium]|nr:FAD-dependent oxidoreductase [Syntrophales bacterium]
MFPHLFAPGRIGNLEIRNRIVMLPMTMGYSEADGTVGDRFIAYFTERAKGGAGLIMIPFSPLDVGSFLAPAIYDDRYLPGIRRLTDALRAEGAKSACQLIVSYHVSFGDGPAELVGPSPVLNQMLRQTPRALTVEEIHSIVGEYGTSARRAREGGFDAVEFIVGGGYLLNRFLSPITNQREDEYGGSLENRMRILLEIVASIRKEAGDDFPLGVRLNVEEQMPGGHTIEISKGVARVLEEAGVSFINTYTGWHESRVPTVAPFVPKGGFADLAGAIKGAVGIPVIAANRINDPVTAERILAEGKADFVGMGRAFIADPQLPNKAREGRVGEIVPCLACGNCLSDILVIYKDPHSPASVSCTVNPLAGHELDFVPAAADRPRNVFVAGGGPAGMETALIAAERGHRVTLFEKENKPGGWLRVGCLPPHKEDIRNLAGSLAARARKAGVEIRLGTALDAATVESGKPDVLIVAVGAVPIVPDIPGIRSDRVVSAEDVLTGKKTVPGKVVVLGGGLVGCETAEFLVTKGKGIEGVTVLEMLDRLAPTVSTSYRPFFLGMLKMLGIRLENRTTVEEITDRGVKVNRQGTPEFIEADWVVLAAGLRVDLKAVEAFRGMAPEVIVVGDCVRPRMIKEAMQEGLAAGLKV